MYALSSHGTSNIGKRVAAQRNVQFSMLEEGGLGVNVKCQQNCIAGHLANLFCDTFAYVTHSMTVQSIHAAPRWKGLKSTIKII